MKYIIIAVLFVICLVVGFTFFNKYDKRKKFFSSLIMLAEKLTVEINFSRERLKVLIENFDKNTKQNLLGIDEGFVSYLDKKTELNEKEIFKKADVLIQKLDKKTARPVKMIAAIYRKYFDIMQNRGWEVISPKPQLSKMKKLTLALRAYFGK